MAILSAKYGLINAETIIEPYNQKMDPQRANELENQVIITINGYDRVIFYKGGSSKPYRKCVEEACRKTGTAFISFGYANQGDINLFAKFLP